MQVIIPMTGYGSRFVAAGYKELKPFISVDNMTILEWIVKKIYTKDDEFIFICRKEHIDTIQFIYEFLNDLAPKVKIVTIADWVKKGPVFDVMRAEDFICDNKPTIINYCDFYMIWDYQKFQLDLVANNCDGAIPCYTGFHPNLIPLKNVYASCKTDDHRKLIAIKEKHSFEADKKASSHSAGVYYFKTGAILKQYCQRLISDNDMLKGEYYASMVYNNMVKDGLNVWVPNNVEYFCQWGTPEDLNDFLFWYNNIKGWIK